MPADELHNDKTQSFVALTPDTTVSHYKIVRKISSGGMGDVYLGLDTELDRRVALKFLPPNLCRDEDCRKRFMREARAAAGLSHNNIVTIYEVSVHRESLFIAMELVEGESLKELIARGLPDARAIIRILLEVCRGLATAHAKNIVHRDIKPGNILLKDDGTVKIVDFGIARVGETMRLTSPGSLVGTVGYMSPEQARGEDADTRSDIFSIGILAYEMIAGRTPFDRRDFAATINAVIHEPVPPLSPYRSDLEVPGFLYKIIERALAKDVSERYQSIKAMAEDLASLLSPSGDENTGLRSVKAVAVMPLRNLGPETDDYLSYGITEDLIVDLTRVNSLRISPLRSVVALQKRDVDLKTVASDLNVGFVFDGSLQKNETTLRLSVQLVDVERNRVIWAERWEEPSESLPHVKKALAHGVARALGVDISTFGPLRIGAPATSDSLAYEYYLRAKYAFDHKRDSQDLEVALGLYRKALDLDGALVAAVAGTAEILIYQGNFEKAESQLLSGLEVAEKQAMKPEQAAIFRLLCELHSAQSRWPQAMDYSRRAVEILKELHDLAGEARALGSQISILLHRSEFDKALALFDRVVELNRMLADDEKVAEAFKNMGKIHRQMADYDRAVELYEEALKLARKQGNLSLEAACLGNLGNVHLCRDNYDAALRNYDLALAIDTRLGNKASTQAWHTNIAHIVKSRGDYRKALEHINSALATSEDLGDRRVYVHGQCTKCEIYLELGDNDAAREAAERALATAEELNYVPGISAACLLLGSTMFWKGDHGKAEEYYDRALEVAEEKGLKRNIAWAHLQIGELHFAGARMKTSLEHFEKAARISSEIGEINVVYRSRAHMIALSSGDGDSQKAISELRQLRSDAEGRVDLRNSLLIKKLLGQLLMKNDGGDEAVAEGRSLLENVLRTAENNGLATEIRQVRAILKQ